MSGCEEIATLLDSMATLSDGNSEGNGNCDDSVGADDMILQSARQYFLYSKEIQLWCCKKYSLKYSAANMLLAAR